MGESKIYFKVTGVVFILFGISSFIAFELLRVNFEYPDILREEVDYILRKYESNPSIQYMWYIMTISSIAIMLGAILMHISLKGYGIKNLQLITTSGFLLGLFNSLGFMRWVFLVPELAYQYSASTSIAQKESIEVVFSAFHNYFGLSLGEHLGFFFIGLYVALLGFQLMKYQIIHKTIWIIGLIGAVGTWIGILEGFGVPEAAFFAEIGSSIVIIWIIIIGVYLVLPHNPPKQDNDLYRKVGHSSFVKVIEKSISKNIVKLLIIGICLLPSLSNAQTQADVVGVKYDWYPKTNIKNLPDGHVLNNREVGVSTLEIWGSAPVIDVLSNSKIYTQLSYRKIQFNYDNDLSVLGHRPNNLHEIKSLIILSNPLGKNWNGIITLMPSLNSDFNHSIEGRDFLIQGALSVEKVLSGGGLRLGAGIFSTYVFGDLQIIPLITFYYDHKKWLIEGYFPRYNMLYRLGKNSEMGLVASFDGAQYNLTDFDFNGSDIVDHAKYTIVNFGLQYNRRLFGGIWAISNVGGSFGKSNELFSEQTIVEDYSLENTFFFRAGLTFRIEE